MKKSHTISESFSHFMLETSKLKMSHLDLRGDARSILGIGCAIGGGCQDVGSGFCFGGGISCGGSCNLLFDEGQHF